MQQFRLTALGVVTAVAVFAVGCDNNRVANTPPVVNNNTAAINANGNVGMMNNTNNMNNPAMAGDAANVTVANIMSNATNYTGRSVTVDGWVERAYGANAFRLDEDSVFTGGIDNDLLVVGAPNVVPAGLRFGTDDARVRVTGTVRTMVAADIERELGWDLTPEIEAEFNAKPVLVARTVQVIERDR